MSREPNLLQQQPLILASGSAIRAKLLTSLGLQFLAIPSHCDEETIKLHHQSEHFRPLEKLAEGKDVREEAAHRSEMYTDSSAESAKQFASSVEFQERPFVDLGFALARAKALEVSQHHLEHFVIAADQLCVINDRVLDKPLKHQTAVEHLQLLSGKTHQQIACVCIAKNNKILWQYHDVANLLVRDLAQNEIDAYLRCEEPYHSCGAYQYESLGKWLFKEVEGQEDTILGLPLLPLTNALIRLGAVRFA